MKVFRVISSSNRSSREDCSMMDHGDLNGAIFVAPTLDQALAWALQLSHNLDDGRDSVVELEVSKIRNLNLKPTDKWSKSDPMSFAADSEFPFEHPRFQRIRTKWHRFATQDSYGNWCESGICTESETERSTPFLFEAVILPEDIIGELS